MKDFHGKDLSIGDYVVFCRPDYRDFTIGKVIKFTTQKVRLIYKLHYGDAYFNEFLTSPHDVVKMDAEDTSILLLKGKGLPNEPNIV